MWERFWTRRPSRSSPARIVQPGNTPCHRVFRRTSSLGWISLSGSGRSTCCAAGGSKSLTARPNLFLPPSESPAMSVGYLFLADEGDRMYTVSAIQRKGKLLLMVCGQCPPKRKGAVGHRTILQKKVNCQTAARDLRAMCAILDKAPDGLLPPIGQRSSLVADLAQQARNLIAQAWPKAIS
jgi:hypothetical protein